MRGVATKWDLWRTILTAVYDLNAQLFAFAITEGLGKVLKAVIQLGEQ